MLSRSASLQCMDTQLLSKFMFHPPLAGFPLALLTTVLVLELAALRPGWEWLSRCAFVCLIASAVSVGLAFLSGYSASERASATFQVADELIGWHHTIGRLLLFCIIPSVAIRHLAEIAQHGAKAFRALYLVRSSSVTGWSYIPDIWAGS